MKTMNNPQQRMAPHVSSGSKPKSANRPAAKIPTQIRKPVMPIPTPIEKGPHAFTVCGPVFYCNNWFTRVCTVL